MTFVERMAVEIQLFRHIFLDTYNLPDDFNFASYYSISLDALTADLVELLPSSYMVLILLIVVVEYLVRHYPYSIEHFMHPGKRESISEFKAVFLYGLIGFLIFAVYVYLLVVTRRATFAIIKNGFPRFFDVRTTAHTLIAKQASPFSHIHFSHARLRLVLSQYPARKATAR